MRNELLKLIYDDKYDEAEKFIKNPNNKVLLNLPDENDKEEVLPFFATTDFSMYEELTADQKEGLSN